MDNSNIFYLAEVIFFFKNNYIQCYRVLTCRSQLEAQRSFIILAKVSRIRRSSAKASLAPFHTMIILMHENMSREALS